LTKLCRLKLGGPVIMPHRVVADRAGLRPGLEKAKAYCIQLRVSAPLASLRPLWRRT